MLFLSLCHDHGHWKLPRVASRLIGVQLFNYFFFKEKVRLIGGDFYELLIYQKYRHYIQPPPPPFWRDRGVI